MTVISVAVIGGGPGGLMAAEKLSAVLPAGSVTVYERKTSIARKFLMAGRGGLNITHSEEIDAFTSRYGAEGAWLRPMLNAFTPQDMRDWCHGLGEETFIGSSGRVFPTSFKASPLLRAWRKRLEEQGVVFKTGFLWQGWNDDGELVFNDNDIIKADAVLLALGGASWPRLGSDAAWVYVLSRRGVSMTPFQPANSGFLTSWSPVFSEKFAGAPLKSITARFRDIVIKGEAMITATGIEGGLIYAMSRPLREACLKDGHAELILDLKPDMSEAVIMSKLDAPMRGLSWSNYLRKSLNLPPVAIGLLREKKLDGLLPPDLAVYIKNYPLRLSGTAPIETAISSAGGISLDAVDDRLMLKALPGVFACGEMLDWEAPTGGYLLQASFSTAIHAAKGMLDWLSKNR